MGTNFLLCFSLLVLHGLDLESEHCVFENVGGTVTLIPLSGSQCSVNGVQIVDATQLNQGIWFCFSEFSVSVEKASLPWGSICILLIKGHRG